MKHYETTNNGSVYRIEDDYPAVGAYLYVYEHNICKYDYLQDSIADCMEFAFEEFGVSITSWNEVVREPTNETEYSFKDDELY